MALHQLQSNREAVYLTKSLFLQSSFNASHEVTSNVMKFKHESWCLRDSINCVPDVLYDNMCLMTGWEMSKLIYSFHCVSSTYTMFSYINTINDDLLLSRDSLHITWQWKQCCNLCCNKSEMLHKHFHVMMYLWNISCIHYGNGNRKVQKFPKLDLWLRNKAQWNMIDEGNNSSNKGFCKFPYSSKCLCPWDESDCIPWGWNLKFYSWNPQFCVPYIDEINSIFRNVFSDCKHHNILL